MEQFKLTPDIPDYKEPPKKTRRYKTMQETYGKHPVYKCGTCKHCHKYDYHNRTYKKCDLWIVSHSEATDIRLKDTACNKYESTK